MSLQRILWLVVVLSAPGARGAVAAEVTTPFTLDTDFSDAIAALGVDVPLGDFYAGVQFSEFMLGPSFFGGSGIRTRIAESSSIPSVISFAQPVSSVSLRVRTQVPTRLTLSLGAAPVSSFQTGGAGYASPVRHDFSGAMFDRLQFTHDLVPADPDDRFLGIDHLRVTTVPLPNAGLLFVSGLLAGWRRCRRSVSAKRHVRAHS